MNGPADGVDPDRIGNITDLGAALTNLRQLAGMTIRDVARATGIKLSTLSGYYSGRHVPQVHPPDVLAKILRASRVTDESMIHRWGSAVSRVRYKPGRPPAGMPAPYRGLACYQPEHVDWFYGREAMVDAALARLDDSCLPLFIVGASGAGKSSLLRAGVIPAVLEGRLPGIRRYLLMTPGDDPCQELADQFADLIEIAADELATSFVDSPLRAAEVLRREIGAGTDGDESGGLLLAVDQFDELFTKCPDEASRRAFMWALRALAEPADGQPRLLVAVTMRADFYAQASNYIELGKVLERNQIVVGPMTEAELDRAIAGPADRAGLTIEPGLVDLLLRDFLPTGAGELAAEHNHGVLPMLSQALLVIWEQRRRRTLTVQSYRDIGGIRKVIAASAEEAFSALDSHDRDLARMIFLRLVHIDDRMADARRRVPLEELQPDGMIEKTAAVVGQFVAHRLLTVGADGVEISHDALLREWPRLRAWLDADRIGLRVRLQVDNAARRWQEEQRDDALLYQGTQLETARGWADDPSHTRELTELERDFLAASTARQTAAHHAERRRVRRRWALASIVSVLILVASVLSGYVIAQSRAAQRERDIAQSVQLAEQANLFRTSDVSLSMQLGLEAYRISPTPQARASLLDAAAVPAGTRLLDSRQVLQTVAVAPGGRWLATSGVDGRIRLWDLSDRRRPRLVGSPLTGPTDTVFSVAFSPDDRLLAEGGADRVVRLWNVANPAHPAPIAVLAGPTNTVYSVAFSPNGRILAAGGADNVVRLWDMSNAAHPRPIGAPLRGFTGFVQSVVFSPNGQLLAAGSADRTVRLWSMADPAHPILLGGPLTGPTAKVFSVAFSPDGRTLAEGSADRLVRLWNVADPGQPRVLGAPLAAATGWINAVAFDGTANFLAAAGSDNVVRLWDLSTRTVIETLPHPGPITGLAFTDQGRTLATSAADGVVRLWSVPGPLINDRTGPVYSLSYSAHGSILAVSSGHQPNTVELWDTRNPRRPTPFGAPVTDPVGDSPYVGSLGVSPNGRILAIGCLDGSVQLWNIADPRHPDLIKVLRAATQLVESFTFSPDGNVLAAGGDDKVVRLWDVRRPADATLLATLTGPGNYVYGVTFSADGELLAAGSADDKTWVWDVSTPTRPRRLPMLTGFSSYVLAPDFSPHGRLLAVGSADKTVRLWDLSNPEHPVSLGPPLTAATNYVYSVAFTPDGHTLVAGSTDHTVLLWDVSTPRRPALLGALSAATDSVFVVVVSPDGHTVAAGTADQTVRLWTIDPGIAAAEICAVAGDPITRQEWAQYIPNRPYQPPCG